jgi:NAD(P)H-dependent flavin oxidoreductase YrpB (nitropropane dioxygenase family)
VITTGMVVGLIDDIPSCSELVERIVAEAAKIVERGLPGKLAG